MRMLALLALSGCVAGPGLTTDTSALEIPRGAGVDVGVALDDQPASLDEVTWTVDAPIVTVATVDGKLRITGVTEGDTIVRVGSHGQTIELPTHVAAPAVVQMWIDPTSFSAAMGTSVTVHATAIDTTSTIRDVTHEVTWSMIDPTVAMFDHDDVLAASPGSTTLRAVLGDMHTSAFVTVY